jgi:hypothetical protein
MSGNYELDADLGRNSLATISATDLIEVRRNGGRYSVSAATVSGGNQGSSSINFGYAPGTNIATAIVTGQNGIVDSSNIRAWIDGRDSTATHNAYEHALLPMAMGVTVTSVIPGVGFSLQASTELRLSGAVAVRWAWN